MWKSSVQFSKVIFSSCLSFTSLCHFVVTPFNMGMRMANMRTIMTMGIIVLNMPVKGSDISIGP